jgi:2-oxoglutarate ferredoxin oxidoreductase subunit alpha
MPTRKLMKGNVALCYGALAAGCDAFFGYPITPQNEVPEYMSTLMPENGRVFVQAESEVSSINMVYGAASAGKRSMTSSSSPGVSLMQEGISYIAACELPCVIVNVQRGGPGLGNIFPSQADYFQAVKGGGHGDYKLITLAPWSVQECYDLMPLAFELADKYRNPAMILMDAIIGQMIEPLTMPDESAVIKHEKPWATTGNKDRDHNVINSLWMFARVLEDLNIRMQAKYAAMQRDEVRYSAFNTEDADIVLIAYGCSARVCRTVVDMAASEGLKLGLFRPITLLPFPTQQIRDIADAGKKIMVVEMSHGQMLEDVRLAVEGRTKVGFYGRSGGNVPNPVDTLAAVKAFAKDRVEA